MDTQKRTFGWDDAIAVFVMTLVLLSVVYPFLMRNDNRTRGVVIDDAMRPIPGVVLEIRDRAGRALGKATTDVNGDFFWNRAWKLQGTTFGKYGVTRIARSSGGRDHIYLAPLVLHRVRVRNAVTGLPQPDLVLRAALDNRPFSYLPDFHPTVCETLETGNATIGTFPSTARMKFDGLGTSVKVWSVISTVVYPKEPTRQIQILYDVTVVPTGTISGRVVSLEGNVVYGADIGLRLVHSAFSDSEASRLRNQGTGTDGKFLFSGLVPGRYILGCALTDGREGSRDVFVSSGQTSTITLKTSDFSPSPMLPPDIR